MSLILKKEQQLNNSIVPLVSSKPKSLLWVYPAVLVVCYMVWVLYMTMSSQWGLFLDYWAASVTMILGSFVAGSTAAGGGAVAFPVFTKVLNLTSQDACVFSLMIQSFGMGMAALFILTRRIPLLPKVILYTSLGGVIGQVLGTFWLIIPGAYPKILFTFVITVFGVVLYISTYILKWRPLTKMPEWNVWRKWAFFSVGIVGGVFAAQVGSGIDTLAFVVLTLAFGIDEKISVPSSVIIMAINAWVGFFLHGVVLDDIGPMWEYWLVAVEVVILGAPLGAFVVMKINRHAVINFLLVLISIELVTTLVLIPIRTPMQIGVTLGAVIFFGLFFWLLLHYRHEHLPEAELRNLE